MQQVLQRAAIVRTSSVENIPGAAGTIGLARFIGAERGSGDVVMVSGLIMLGAIVTHASPVTLREVTPIARLTGEYEAIVVPAASPISIAGRSRRGRSREKPESISWGGGSAGGSDQMLAGLIAEAVGVSPRRVNYIAFSGGGESMSAILGGQVSAGINGLAEFAPQIDAGAVRVLGISSAERLPGVSAPTLREQGVDVEFENWRSLVAPPGISAVDRERLERAVDAMVRSAEWREALQRFRWIDRYLTGGAFDRFAQAEDQRVRTILIKLGLGSDQTTASTSRTYPLLVLTGLLFFACAALLETVRSRAASPRRRRRCDDRRRDDRRWEPCRVDCRGDGDRPGVDGAGRLRAGVYGALLADGTGFRPSAPWTRRAVRARRLGRRICSIRSRAQRDAAGRVHRALAGAVRERHGDPACAASGVCRRPDSATPRVGIGRCHARYRGRRASGHRSRPDRRASSSRDLHARTDERVHHVRRHLLRGYVWRVHHQHPAEYPGRDGVDRHRHRRPHDGTPGPRARQR